MFVLGTDEGKQLARKKAFRYIPVTLFVMIFSFVYELFGHGVYSVFMIGAFAFPLLMGVVFWLIMSGVKRKCMINNAFSNIWTSMLYTLLLGFIYKGVLDIYGTASNLTYVYWIAGVVLGIAALIAFFATWGDDKEEE